MEDNLQIPNLVVFEKNNLAEQIIVGAAVGLITLVASTAIGAATAAVNNKLAQKKARLEAEKASTEVTPTED